MRLTVGQPHGNNIRSHYSPCETLYPSSIPQNLCAYQKRKPAFVRCDPFLYLELGFVLWSGHLVLDFLMYPTCEDFESINDDRSLF